MNFVKVIEVQIKQRNFKYVVVDKTFPIANRPEWHKELIHAINYINEKYEGRKIKIIEEESDYLSNLDRRDIREGLKDLL